jgi:hypothetical protein
MLRFSNLSAHPDGQRILFSSRGTEEKNTEIWALEDFLPGATAEP